MDNDRKAEALQRMLRAMVAWQGKALRRMVRPVATSARRIAETAVAPMKRYASGIQTELSEPETAEMLKRANAAHDLPPDNPKRRPWESLDDVELPQARGLWRYLPDPLKRRGRPHVVDDRQLMCMHELVTAGVPKTTAARRVLEAEWRHGNVKGAADHLVRKYPRAFYSG